MNPGTYEASYYQSQNNKFLGIKTVFVDPDTDPYSWIVTDNLMGFNAMIMNRSDTSIKMPGIKCYCSPTLSVYTSYVCPHAVPGAGSTLTMDNGKRTTR